MLEESAEKLINPYGNADKEKETEEKNELETIRPWSLIFIYRRQKKHHLW